MPPVQVIHCPRRLSRNAFKALKAAQKKYQLQIKPWTLEEEQFKFTARFPFVEAVCLHCSTPVPPGLRNSAAFEWMICHLNGYSAHAYAEFPDKCKALTYSQRGQFWARHRDYWLMQMWFGVPDFDSPFFMAPPTQLAYSPQLILHEPSFAEGVRYHHVFNVDQAMLRTLHEEVLRKIAKTI